VQVRTTTQKKQKSKQEQKKILKQYGHKCMDENQQKQHNKEVVGRSHTI
jgi:hypothetical protein